MPSYKQGVPLLATAATMTLNLAVSTTAGAQQATLEEVVVTARRISESIQDAPLAVNVMNGDFMRDQQILNIQDIIELTPGATWGEFTKAQPAFSMRGINAGNFGNSSLESAVQLVVDGVAQTKAFMMTPPVYDLERVEIMRGPQGTSFGRNATVGLLHFITARPTQESSGALNMVAGSLGRTGLDGYYTGGLSDSVSGRIAFNYKEGDGDMEDGITGDAIESYETTSIRASLLFEPSDTFTGFIKFEYNKDEDLPVVRRGESSTVCWLCDAADAADGNRNNGPPYVNSFTDFSDPWQARQSSEPTAGTWTGRPGWFTEREITSLTGEFAWLLNNDVSITSLTGWQDGDHDTQQDVFGAPEVIQDQFVHNDAEILSTELRIDNFASGDAFRWLGGIYLLSDEENRREANVGFPVRGNGGGRAVPQAESHLLNIGLAESSSIGVFGELSFDLSDNWNLTVGGRYTEDTRDYTFETIGWGRYGALMAVGKVDPVYGGDPARDCDAIQVAGICGSEAAPGGFDPEFISRTWDNFSGRIALTWNVNDNNNLYALYSQGWKSGGFQHDARNVAALQGFVVQPEETENFEIGWKGSYDRARFAVTVFQIEQTNAQQNALVPVGSGFTTSVANFGGVENTGIEFEGTVLLGDNFELGGNVAFYDAELGPGSVLNGSFDPNTGQVVGLDVAGRRPNNSPEQTYMIYGQYDFNLSGGSTISLRADWQHRDSVWARTGDRNIVRLDGSGPTFLRPAIDNVGALIRWTNATGNISVSLWGKNLKDDRDWKNIGPPISFHFNHQGQTSADSGNLIGSAPRGSTGREFYGIDASFRF